MITSLYHPLVKHLVKLRESRCYREEMGTLLITGTKLVREIAAHTPPKRIFVQSTSPVEAPETYIVTDAILKKITGLPSPEPIAAEFPLPHSHLLMNQTPLLALDAIRDPGNLGTLLRTALALGWGGVFLLPTCVDLFHDKVIRSSRAAAYRLPWRIGNWEELTQLCNTNGLHAYIADVEGLPLSHVPASQRILLLLSNEAQGVGQKAEHLGQKITIPMSGEMESLNVAIAGGILMYQLK
jgi:RNA methyltransferase, TrmH family